MVETINFSMISTSNDKEKIRKFLCLKTILINSQDKDSKSKSPTQSWLLTS